MLLGLDELNSITCLEQCLALSKWSVIVVGIIIIPIIRVIFPLNSLPLPPLKLAGNSKTLRVKSYFLFTFAKQVSGQYIVY